MNWGTAVLLFPVHGPLAAVTLLTDAHLQQGDNPMGKAAPPQRWFSGWRAPAAAPDSDPADFGTAYGLDLSLHEAQAPAPGPAPVHKAAPRRGWMQRLAARGKPAA